MIGNSEAAWGDPEEVSMPPGGSNSGEISRLGYAPKQGGGLVLIADIEAALNGGTLPMAGAAWGDEAWADVPPIFAPAGGSETARVSDMGWRGFLPYPPLLIGGPDIDRRIALAPGSSGTFGWGTLRLANPGSIVNASLEGKDTALRKVRIRAGLQWYDTARGYVVDPAPSALLDIFNGLAGTWQPKEDEAQVPLRDATSWLERPISSRQFAGTGNAEGPASLAGRPWPIVRGGSASFPVRSIPVILVDSVKKIYRWTDVGNIVAVYEDGAPVYTNAGAVADVFVSAPSAGTFVYDATGQFRLGSDPDGTITVDGWYGDSNPATIVRNLLMDTLALPAGLFDEGSALTLAAQAPYVAGWAWTGTEKGKEAIQPLLSAANGRLICSRTGGLKLFGLKVLSANAKAVFNLTQDNCESCSPVVLESPLTPPPADWSVGFGKTHERLTTLKDTVDAGDRERLAQSWRTARWFEPTNLTRYALPSKPPLLETALLKQADAQAIADSLGFLWGLPRRLWQVTIPAPEALMLELGDVVSLKWPTEGLRYGALGQIVGDTFRAGQATSSVLVLV